MMKHILPPALFTLTTRLLKGALLLCLFASPAWAAGGTCPSGSNYTQYQGATLTTLSALGVTSCYYVSANGIDTNTGTDESHPWAHAPGMPNCASTCAAETPTAGVGIIFKGGDAWHYGAGTPLIGGSWTFSWSGSSGSPIYLGVDQTWFTGGSWTRPIITGDNPISTTPPSSCLYNDDSLDLISTSGHSWQIWDNFEFRGKCWEANTYTNGTTFFITGSTNMLFSNQYHHGWGPAVGSSDNHYAFLAGAGSANSGNVWAFDVFDGSDSVSGTTTATCKGLGPPCVSGNIMYIDEYDVHMSVFKNLSNFAVSLNAHTWHDNLLTGLGYTYSNVNQQHPNVMNTIAGPSGQTFYFYNNVMRNNNVPENMYTAVLTNAYFFNNVFYQDANMGCIYMNSLSNSAATQNLYAANNTFGDNTCVFDFYGSNSPLTPWNGTAYYQNNHLINNTALSGIYYCSSGGGGAQQCTQKDNGNEVYQPPSSAASQGYVISNNFAPTSTAGATVGNGANLTSSCATYSPDRALCSGTSGGVAEVSGSGGRVASYPAIPIVLRPSSGAWDAGAYEYGSANQMSPPTGLTATVE